MADRYYYHQIAKLTPLAKTAIRSSYAERHNRVDNIVVILPQSLDCLLARDVGLGHNQINILGLQAALVNLLAVILLLFLLGLGLRSLALALVLAVVVTSVITGGFGGSQLLCGRSLGLGVQVLDLGLTEDTRWELAYASFLIVADARTSRCCCWGSGRRRAG